MVDTVPEFIQKKKNTLQNDLNHAAAPQASAKDDILDQIPYLQSGALWCLNKCKKKKSYRKVYLADKSSNTTN